MRSFLFLGFSSLLVLLAACGGSVVAQLAGGAGTTSATSASSAGAGTGAGTSSAGAGAGTTTSAATSTSSTGTGGASEHGACHTSADCDGKPCEPLTPGGYLVCIDPVAEATSCQLMGPPNQCCTTGDCPSGEGCYTASSIQSCGGALQNYNICVADGCMSDAGCVTPAGPAICTPAGAFGYPKRQCLTAYCRTDAECTAKPGGACVPIGGNPCCSLRIPDGLGCAYPGDCAAGVPCPGNEECRLDQPAGTSSCQAVMPCPP